MDLNVDQLAACTGATLTRATMWLRPIGAAADAFEINNPERLACFLAQIGHESGGLAFVTEIWGPTPAQAGYQGRADLGNLQPGDGYNFRGRGLIQITGRANYRAARDGLRATQQGVPDFEWLPDTLAQPDWAAMTAAWFWFRHGLNDLADNSDFETITRRINGGLSGLAHRQALWDAACAQLGAAGGLEATTS